MLRTIIAIVVGFVAASTVMMAFEYANSQMFPFPAGTDLNDIGQVRAFAATMPLSALAFVAVGWSMGSLLAGIVSTRIAGGESATPALVTGVLLTAFGAVNAWMIQNPLWFHLGGLPIFMLGAVLGEWAGRKRA